ncbi:ATP-dependent nuclease [Sinanaerobacter chloroacetimidivorans]|uniref:ATP-dependent endonuclease n=1 Tax=Sinanaerobacter chloroacetimidivorans TaxID=2818044 RepID=A0A8J7VYM9_9FIRM|nr:ATP-dependent endonuclease [Sinanaerobacter chloroacetimidivorans]MBR0597479.1 ATP-dependent endonuclease [Sinanaerobacter chloroacetimidivorans]
MYVNKIHIRNFRILSQSTLDFKDKLCLMIGRNNSGKTSFFVLFEKFINGLSFDFNDFSLCKRQLLLALDESSVVTEFSIQLILNIKYEESDDLCHLSEFIMDLDPARQDVNLLFECCVKKEKLLESISLANDMSKEKFIKKYLSDYLEKCVYTFDSLDDLKPQNRHRLIKKELKDVKKLIDFEIIHAKRSVSSSEEKTGAKVLSALATSFFNNKNVNSPDKFEAINKLIEDMDSKLGVNYEVFFNDFLRNAKDFLGLDGLKIVSNLKAHEIINDSSEVIYGSDVNQLPEYLNGLGHMNILYLLLNMEIKKSTFIANNKDIKLLFIEEPEAHTHPQLQYIFARKVSEIVDELPGVQTIITTHSPHIVANHPFENIRYMLIGKDSCGYTNIEIKNFYKDLRIKYQNEMNEFQFLKQYLTIESAELFFADKAIFIEGVSENMLMPYFVSKYDTQKTDDEKKFIKEHTEEKSTYIPLASQNVSFLQVGANAKAFRHFLEFLQIPTVIITDIDTTKSTVTKSGAIRYTACSVEDSPDNTSNETIKYYLDAPDINDKNEFKTWLQKLIDHNLPCSNQYISVAYQQSENNYHPRSFEDSFINVNLDQIKKECVNISGLKNIDEIESYSDIYDLTQNIIDKKSDFASSILFMAHVNNKGWIVPSYIWEGFEWLQKR